MPSEHDSATPFHATRWSLVHRVQGGGDDGARALEELCAAYWFPLYGWARRSGVPPADAEDLVQGFFANVVRKQLFARADPAQGRLRTFLLTSFRNYQRDMHDRSMTERRGADRVVSFDVLAGEEAYLAQGVSAATADAFYDRHWALTVLDLAMKRVEEEYARRGKDADFAQLRRHLTAASETGYDEDSRALGVSPGAVRVAAHRMRERFREALRAEVASTQGEGEDIDEELSHLLRALGT